ncbi:hypothetical protein ACQ4PT_038432 [Festuca glaucescens]
MSELRALYLQHNALSGEVPASLYTLKNLVRLNLGENRLSGEISPDFNKLNRLGSLLLESNEFAGEIPKLDLPTLEQFNVSYNSLNGSSPPSSGRCPRTRFWVPGSAAARSGCAPGETAETPAGSEPGAGAGGAADVGKKKKKLSGGAIAGIAIGCVHGGGGRRGGASTWPRWTRSPRDRTGQQPATASTALVPLSQCQPQPPSPPSPVGRQPGRRSSSTSGPWRRPRRSTWRTCCARRRRCWGKGAFGTAYKAVMESGAAVAVKRLKDVDLPEPEFRERIAAIGAVQHELVVPLRAYYFSKDEKLLVYDYMSMGSLSALLHGNRSSGRTPLDWETRSAIALAAARGVAYIHTTSPTASHGNIKSSNVLLTKTYEARVSDHGLPTLVGPSFSPTRVSGYRAPEVTDIRRVSQKADVYSFGVLLLELLTGKAPTHAVVNEEGLDLPRWVQSVVREEWTAEVFDQELLRFQNVEEEMVQLLQLAIDCSAQHPDKRPTMAEAAARIDDIRRSGQHTTTTTESPVAGDEPSL